MIEILNENEETEIIGGTIPVQAFATNIEVNPGISSYIGETDPIFKASAAYNITNSDIISWNNKASEGYVDTKLMTKQDTLVSGTNIKTINNESILGSGNIEIEGVTNYNELENKPKINNVELSGNKSLTDLGIDLSSKQDILVSGINIKTINNESILGSGNIVIQGGGSSYSAGDGIDITNNTISITGATDSELGGVKVASMTQAQYDALQTKDTNTFYSITDASGDLPPATTTTLGGIIVGDNLTVDSNGVLSANSGGYTLPEASANTLGGVKIWTGTQAEYDAITTKSNSSIYLITD